MYSEQDQVSPLSSERPLLSNVNATISPSKGGGAGSIMNSGMSFGGMGSALNPPPLNINLASLQRPQLSDVPQVDLNNRSSYINNKNSSVIEYEEMIHIPPVSKGTNHGDDISNNVDGVNPYGMKGRVFNTGNPTPSNQSNVNNHGIPHQHHMASTSNAAASSNNANNAISNASATNNFNGNSHSKTRSPDLGPIGYYLQQLYESERQNKKNKTPINVLQNNEEFRLGAYYPDDKVQDIERTRASNGVSPYLRPYSANRSRPQSSGGHSSGGIHAAKYGKAPEFPSVVPGKGPVAVNPRSSSTKRPLSAVDRAVGVHRDGFGYQQARGATPAPNGAANNNNNSHPIPNSLNNNGHVPGLVEELQKNKKLAEMYDDSLIGKLDTVIVSRQ